jgi:tetraacyldisaccharide 4'-kinase
MKNLQLLSDRIRRGDPIPLHLAALLTALTPVTRVGMKIRLSRQRTRVDARVVSFGNITAGGTGKTPAVIERARLETAAGHRVAILTRGYGTGDTSVIAVGPDERNCSQLVKIIGDEPALIRRRVPGVAVVKGADRVAGARMAMEEFQCDVLLLDDGFQYVLLERDENIVLIDATNPFGNGHLIPRGILREPLSALSRATQVMLTRCDQARELGPLLDTIARYAPGVPVRKTRHVPVGLWRVADNMPMPLSQLAGREVTAACAIGNPESFYATLERLGAKVVERRAYRDHAHFEVGAGRPVVVTEKDAVRLSTAPENVWALAVELQDLP